MGGHTLAVVATILALLALLTLLVCGYFIIKRLSVSIEQIRAQKEKGDGVETSLYFVAIASVVIIIIIIVFIGWICKWL